ncbi:sodium:solute symporter [Corynebacterium lizhenjunii]|uniref:Sodium:solute symporter n=1 Tax=Corynebacterium lizhenjunii TaxID=2709394 RepID=A0A7T0KER1_9CORY|nr:sodium:solute symporter [Corynebacterium lizhenjunii]QPK78774.1 sodium:solute symporter [Corynebacterium lizhenjunii]
MEWLDIAVVAAYLLAMVLFGLWGKAKTSNTDDYLVAGRNLGFALYTGTIVTVVLGGASAVGGVGLGYKFGISGLWLVAAIGLGVILLSAFFAPKLQRLKIYTVVEMMTLRYGTESTQVASLVMLAYTLMLTATSTGAYASIFMVLFGWDRWVCILVGSAVVLIYAATGGMWSITLADMAQFVIMTIGVFALMLPFGLHHAGGWSAMQDRLDATFFDIGGMGLQSIITYFVIYTLGLLIGQDIWQRVFTAKTDKVAQWGGVTGGIYCIVFGAAGAIIGMTAAVAMPGIENKDDVFARVAIDFLPVGLGGLALSAGVAAMMSTASGGLIAAATVARTDVLPLLRNLKRGPRTLTAAEAQAMAQQNAQANQAAEDIAASRKWVIGLGLFVMLLAMAVPDVVAALTIAYDILVGGLFVAILGGLVWKRGNGLGAACSMGAGSLVTLGTMGYLEFTGDEPMAGVYANEPIYFGLAASLLVYVVVSLLSKSTDPEVLAAWQYRTVHGAPEEGPTAFGAPAEHAEGTQDLQ